MKLSYDNLTSQQLEEFIEFIDWSIVPYNLITEDIKNKFGRLPGLKARLWFEDLLSQMHIKIYKKDYPDFIFFFIGDEFFMEHDSKKDHLYCSYDRILCILKKEYTMNDTEMEVFIKNIMEKHFKIKVSTLGLFNDIYSAGMEEHFKLKVSTAFLIDIISTEAVENHLKLKTK